MAAVENVQHDRDFHITLLQLLWLDDNKLTEYLAGYCKQLSQFSSKMIEDLIA